DSVAVGNQRNEADEFTKCNHGLRIDDPDELELLRLLGSDWNTHATGVAELGKQGGGQIGSGGRNKDCVEGCGSGKTECTVSGEELDVGIAERGENVAGVCRKGWVAFDGEHLPGKFSEQSGGVSGTSA